MKNVVNKFSSPYIKNSLMLLYFSNFTFSSVISWHKSIVKFILFRKRKYENDWKCKNRTFYFQYIRVYY